MKSHMERDIDFKLANLLKSGISLTPVNHDGVPVCDFYHAL